MKIWARIVETSLREKLPINKQQHGFMGKKNEPTAVCLEIVNGELRLWDLKKACDRVTKEERVVVYEEVDKRISVHIIVMYCISVHI